jgi:hypothetical protein
MIRPAQQKRLTCPHGIIFSRDVHAGRVVKFEKEEPMELKEYFRSTKGLGVLSTADDKGQVDSAVYSSPKVVDDGRVAFIMSDRLSLANVRKNPHAAYLFKENGEGWQGVRLFLEYESETREGADITAACRDE